MTTPPVDSNGYELDFDDEGKQFDPAVPAGYIPTGRANRELIARYQGPTGLNAAKHPKAKAKTSRERELGDLLLLAIATGQLNAVVLDHHNKWQEIIVPLKHWCETISGKDSIHWGRLMRVDRWPDTLPLKMLDAPVCFREENWRAWSQKHLESVSVEKAPVPPVRDHRKKVKPSYEEVAIWFRALVQSAGKIPPERGEVEKAAVKYFGVPGLRKLVRRAHAEFAPAYWKITGNKNRKRAKDG